VASDDSGKRNKPATMMSAVVEDVLVCVHTGAAPFDHEWDAHVGAASALCERRGEARFNSLVVTEGGGPNARQRAALVKALAGKNTQLSIVSDALLVRGIVTAMSWFVAGQRMFPVGQFSSACDHLGLHAGRAALCEREVNRMRRELGLALLRTG